MINAQASSSPGYYLKAEDELSRVGQWAGKLAVKMALGGIDAFKAMVKNRTPEGGKLTQRDNPKRRQLYDLTFCEPKSVSIMEQVMGDRRIAKAREESIEEIMREMVEPLAAIHKRVLGKTTVIETGNLAYLPFHHALSRPVEGTSDPNGHCHVTIQNASEHNGKRYALEIRPIMEAMPLIEAAWHAKFAGKLQDLGYDIRKTKTAFEIEGVQDSTIRKFSRRSEIIELEAKRREIKSPKGKAALGALTREKKRAIPSVEVMHKEWESRLSWSEAKGLKATLQKAVGGRKTPKATQAPAILQTTLDRLLLGESCVREQKLLTEALKAGVGEVTLPELKASLKGHMLASVDGVGYVTSSEARRKEKDILDFAGSLRIVRKKGDIPTDKGERLLTSPGLHQLHQAVVDARKGNYRLVIQEPKQRDYRVKERGVPAVFLEDLARLSTGQERPKARVVDKVISMSKAVKERVRKQAMRYQEPSRGQELAQEIAR